MPDGEADVPGLALIYVYGVESRWSAGRPHGSLSRRAVRGAILAAVVQAVGTTMVAPGDVRPTTVQYGLLIAGALPLVLRYRWPMAALVGALGPTAVYFGLGYPDGPGFVAAVVATFTAVKAGRRRPAWIAVGVAYAGYVALAATVGDVSPKRIVAVAIWTAVILGFAEASRVRAAHLREMNLARAEQQRARAEEERAEKEQERRKASEERLRIAQELHDVLGHHLSLINVQAGVGLHLMDERPEQAREALAAIKHASAEALRETRAVLAALHPGDGAAPRNPTPGLADLDRLVAEVEAAGLPVSVHAGGTPRPLPSEVDRAAYRIVQEALTNVRRHAGPDVSATITIGYGESDLTVRVTDDGIGSTVDGADGGNGIAGMRQRALALGGEVRAGFRPEGGFEVCVVLPVREETR